MMNRILLISAMTIATPVLAQGMSPAAPAGKAKVAAIVDSEFPSHDKDASGTLSPAEFAAWMDRLKATPDPRWNDAAFRLADTDASRSLTKAELAGFLGTSTTAVS